MIDCTKPFSKLAPSEAWHCLWNHRDWETIARNRERMWNSFTNTTIGEWAEIILAFALIPALLVTYILPFYLLFRLVTRANNDDAPITPAESRKKKLYGSYMIVAGFLTVAVNPNDPFFSITGAVMMILAILIFVLSPAWWRSTLPPETTR